MITTGLERFLGQHGRYRGRRIALIANQTSITRDFVYGWQALKLAGFDLVRVFSPEHGLFGTEQDQVAVTREPESGIEICSLYGTSFDSLFPPEESLRGIDLVLFDMQDVGSRYYTFTNTMAYFMEALSGRDIGFAVLDRPNPIGGAVEGPLLEEEYSSFVGVFRVPVRHGLTPGELALMYRKQKNLDLELHVQKMEGWSRTWHYERCALPWVPPSPNMPTVDTAVVYPGGCLVEGTNLSEGRGTTAPFQYIGADFIDPHVLAETLNGAALPGVHFRPVFFKPMFHKFVDMTAGGVFIHVTDRHALLPFLTGVAVVKTAFNLYRDDFRFLRDGYEFNDRYPAFDILCGNGRIRKMIEDGAGLEEIALSWKEDEKKFKESVTDSILYHD